MKFVAVEQLPKNRRGGAKPHSKITHNNVREYLKAFVAMDVKYARVEFDEGEYASIDALRATLYETIVRSPDLPVKRVLRNGDIYLIRTDM